MRKRLKFRTNEVNDYYIPLSLLKVIEASESKLEIGKPYFNKFDGIKCIITDITDREIFLELYYMSEEEKQHFKDIEEKNKNPLFIKRGIDLQ